MEVEGEAGGRIVGDDGLVDVHGALGLAGGAGREVKRREVVRVGLGSREIVRGLSDQRVEVVAVLAAADQHDMLEPGQVFANTGDLAAIEPLGRDEDAGAGNLHA